MPLTLRPRWYTAQVTASTSSALGSRPSAFQRRLQDRAVLAAEILVFMPQCYHVQFGIRLLNHVTETGAQFGCAFNSFQAFGMQFGPAVILEHQCDPQSPWRMSDGFEE